MINILLIACVVALLWQAKPRLLFNSLKRNNTAFHLFFASTLTITLLGFIQGGANVSMPLHFLGLGAATLILGRQLAILSAVLAAIILLLAQKIITDDVGIIVLGGMLLPIIAVDYWRQWLTSKTASVWRFVLYGAVGGTVISMLVKTLILSIYYLGINDIEQSQVLEQYALLSLLFWVPEIMLNSTIILTLIQHKPHWVSTYNAPNSK